MRLLFVAFFMLAACSSNEKKAEPTSPKPEASKTTATKSETKAEAESTNSMVKCAVTGDERLLEVRPKGKGCELAYTKGGKEGVVASSVNGTSHCEATMARIQNRLKGAGFACN